MEYIKEAASIFTEKVEQPKLNVLDVALALRQLLPTTKGDFDLELFVRCVALKDNLVGKLGSWLCDGENQYLSREQVSVLFGRRRVTRFAATLGVDVPLAQKALSRMIAEMVDRYSENGALVEQLPFHYEYFITG